MTHCPGQCYAHLTYNSIPAKPKAPYGLEVIHLHEPVVSIGREKCTVILDSEDMPTTLSRKHAVISRVQAAAGGTSTAVELKDTSTNGTKVNGVKITSAILNDGDTITFGVSDVVYIFRDLSVLHTNQHIPPPRSPPVQPPSHISHHGSTIFLEEKKKSGMMCLAPQHQVYRTSIQQQSKQQHNNEQSSQNY
eukprot:Phypoly_transcript_11803.p1 GENE.Phypoly_transcript_11803~~Phypoly_transcript_11803.p1  ORF type:complete len:211 (+),score=32.61 Phypoly_transcript_11803:59-634(+)